MSKTTNNTIQATWVGLGTLSSFMFSLVSAAIISRFLTKSDYGTYKQVMYVYHTMLVVFTLGLPKAYGYFLPRVNKDEGKSVVTKLNICFMIMGGVFSLILYISAPFIASILANPDLDVCIRIFSPAPLFLLPTMGIEGTMSTYRMTQYGAIYMISTRIFMLICIALPVAFYRSDTITALYGFTVSSLLSCLLALYIKKLPFRKVRNIKSNLTYKQILNFSLPLMVASLWATAIKSADQFFVSRWFGQEVFADFSNGSLELPFVQMVLGAGGVVLLPLFSRHIVQSGNKSELLALWMRVTEKAAYIIYPLVVYCWFFAPLIMTFLYGDQYVNSAIYFRIMLVVNLFTIAQYYPIIVALGATKYYAKVHMFNAFLVWVSEFICVMTILSPYAITTVSVLCHLVKIYHVVRFISNYMEVNPWQLFPIKRLALIFATCSVSAIIAILANEYLLHFEQKIITLIVTFAIFAILAFITGKLFSINYLVVVAPIFQKLKKKIMIKELLSKINLIRDYRAFKKFNLNTDKSFYKFFKYRLYPHFHKNRYYPVDPNSTVSGKNIILGKGSVIGQRGGCYIQGIGKLFIGDYVRITQNCIITSANHSALNHSIEIKKETIIGDYCWIASNACVMAGVVLGPRTIVGAGSVVTKSFPDGYCIIAGNPAKLIKQLDPNEFVEPVKGEIEYYGYIRADKFPAYFKNNLSEIKFEYDLSRVTSNPIFFNK